MTVMTHDPGAPLRLRQGQFSYLPDLTDEEIAAQIRHAIANGWAVTIEYTDDPHPRNAYWELWDIPMFDLTDPGPAMDEVAACRRAVPDHYVAVGAYDASLARQVRSLWFLVQRPALEPGFALERTVVRSARQRYTHRSYAVDRNPAGHRHP